MSRSPGLATALLIFFLVAVPVAFINRFSQGLLPLQPSDVPLALGLGAWLMVSKAVLDRDEPYDTTRHHRLSPRWQAALLVEQSVLGVGHGAKQPPASAEERVAGMSRLVWPTELGPDELAPVIVEEEGGRVPRVWAGEPEVRATPILPAAVSAPPIIATEEYRVRRGDTWWSVAARAFGDGRLWKTLVDMNQGREVAPGVVVEPASELRIGWIVLVPLGSGGTSDEEEAEHHHG